MNGNQPSPEYRGPAPERDRRRVPEGAIRLEQQARAQGVPGLLQYAGCLSTGNRGAYWEVEGLNVAHVLGQDLGSVASVLQILATERRLAILRTVTFTPSTAQELAEILGGALTDVERDLEVLEAADLVFKENRGEFVCRGYRIQGLVLLLAGISNLCDTRYSPQRWLVDETTQFSIDTRP